MTFTQLLEILDLFHKPEPDLLSFDPPTWDWPPKNGQFHDLNR